MNVTKVLTKNYGNKSNGSLAENEPNTNPIKANSKPISPKTNPIKANQSQFKANFTQNEPKMNPISEAKKCCVGGRERQMYMNVLFKSWLLITLILIVLLTGPIRVNAADKPSEQAVLQPKTYRHYIEQFNKRDGDKNPEHAAFPNSRAWTFLTENCPLFDCPDKEFEKIYYYRWWLFRKHIKKQYGRFLISEFIKRDPICCPAGHHLNEGRWLRNRRILDDYVAHWFPKSNKGGDPRKYSFWAAHACYQRFLATADKNWVTSILPDLIENYQKWEQNNHVGGNLFYQNDDRDGMEQSAGGPGLRPTINSYMYGDAIAISKIANLAGKKKLAEQFRAKAQHIKAAVQTNLWDNSDKFFKTVHRKNARLITVKTREAIGFIPWYFNLPDPGYEIAFKHLMDPKGFFAPYGPTTAERRDPTFMTRKDNTPWDGQSWPFATTQTLVAMANLLNNYTQDFVSKKDYFEVLNIYSSCHYSYYKDGTPMLGEWCHPITGKWYIRPWSSRSCSEHYNHSGFCNLVINGLVGIRPQAEPDDLLLNPLLPENKWDYFCLQDVPYHGRLLTVIWDKTGKQYNKGPGLLIFSDGAKIGQRQNLGPLRLKLPHITALKSKEYCAIMETVPYGSTVFEQKGILRRQKNHTWQYSEPLTTRNFLPKSELRLGRFLLLKALSRWSAFQYQLFEILQKG